MFHAIRMVRGNAPPPVPVPSRPPDLTTPAGDRYWRTGPSRWVGIQVALKRSGRRAQAHKIDDESAIKHLDKMWDNEHR